VLPRYDSLHRAFPGARLLVPVTAEDLSHYYGLRWRILRKPWAQPPGSERDEFEDRSIHLMVRGPDGTPLGVARLHFSTARRAHVRYMAVEERHRGRGIGTWLLRALEERARIAGATVIVLNARESAAGFYRRHGYRKLGPAHTLFGTIRHIRMQKRL
jgi:GNAT superfamily N-acetyltransferase